MITLGILLSAAAAIDKGLLLSPDRTSFRVELLRVGTQVQTSLRVQAGADGAIQCELRAKSRIAALDALACPLVVSRLTAMQWRGKAPLKVRWYASSKPTAHNYDGAVPFDTTSWVPPFDLHVTNYSVKTQSVGILLTIASDGSVSACRAGRSSGSETLDQRICELVMKNAAFLPALDQSGNPRVSHASTEISWMLMP